MRGACASMFTHCFLFCYSAAIRAVRIVNWRDEEIFFLPCLAWEK